MILSRLPLTPGLAWHLRRAHDPGEPPLLVRPSARGVVVQRRFRGEEPSPTEEARVRELVAAHLRQPLELPTQGRRLRGYVIVVDGRPPLPVRGPGSSDPYLTRAAAEARVAQLLEACRRRGIEPPPIEIHESWDRTIAV